MKNLGAAIQIIVAIGALCYSAYILFL